VVCFFFAVVAGAIDEDEVEGAAIDDAGGVVVAGAVMAGGVEVEGVVVVVWAMAEPDPAIITLVNRAAARRRLRTVMVVSECLGRVPAAWITTRPDHTGNNLPAKGRIGCFPRRGAGSSRHVADRQRN
jgi:hypothetical protein